VHVVAKRGASERDSRLAAGVENELPPAAGERDVMEENATASTGS